MRAAAAALIAILLVSAACQATPVPPTPTTPASDLAPPEVPIAVTLRVLGGSARVGFATEVTAHALAAVPVASLELWNGTQLVEIARAERASKAMYTTFEWTPLEAGESILFVRAIDSSGRVAQSAVSRVAVAQSASLLELQGEALDDIDLIANATVRFALDLPTLTVAVDGCSAQLTTPPPAGGVAGLTVLQLPPLAGAFLPVATQPAGDAPATFELPLGPGPQLLTMAAFDDSNFVLSDPIEVAGPEGCASEGWSGNARLSGGMLLVDPPADAAVAYLYLQADDGPAVRVPSTQYEFLQRLGPGMFDAAQHLPPISAVSKLTVDAWGWQGGSLVQLGTGTWTAPSSAMQLYSGFAPSVAPPAVTQLWIKKPVLFSGPPPPGEVSSKWSCTGNEFQSCIKLVTQDEIERQPNRSYGETVVDFYWQTQMPGVTKVVWQILPYAPPPNSDLAPPFIIAAQTLTLEPGTFEGEFSIDFGPYLPKESEPSVAAIDYDEAKATVNNSIELALGIEPSQAPPANPNLGSDSGFAVPDLTIGMLPGSVGDYGIQFSDEKFFVRIVPLVGFSPMPPSGPAQLTIVDVTPIELTGIEYAPFHPKPDLTWQFVLPKAPNVKYARCMIVKELTADFKPQAGPTIFWPYYTTYQAAAGNPDKSFCYSPPSDDGWSPLDAFEAFVEFVADVVDFVANAYNSIKNEIVKALASSCDVIPGVSPEDCEPLAEAALTIVLASMGIPPSLPNFSQIVDGLKGDLAGAIVNLGVQLGLGDVCTAAELASAAGAPTCQELAEAALDELIDQIEIQQGKAALKASGWPSYPGVVFAPDPRGLWHPPTFMVTIANNGGEETRTCVGVTADLSSTTFFTWNQVSPGGLVEKSGTVTGRPFLPVSFNLPSLPPGESLTREIVLTELLEWYPNVEAKIAAKMASGGGWGVGHTWALLSPGAQLTPQLRDTFGDHQFSGYHSCVPGGSSTLGPYQLTEYVNP